MPQYVVIKCSDSPKYFETHIFTTNTTGIEKILLKLLKTNTKINKIPFIYLCVCVCVCTTTIYVILYLLINEEVFTCLLNSSTILK